MSELLHSALHSSYNTIPYSRPGTPNSHGPKQIGFVGLGAMGYLMAQNLANRHSSPDDHPPVLVWNRSVAKSESLLAALGPNKIRIAQDLAQVARECDVILTNLANDAVVKSVYEIFVESLKDEPSTTKNRIFVEMSTVRNYRHMWTMYLMYDTLGELDALVSTIPHSHLITCPVFGAPAVAAKGQLVVVMSGDYRSKKEIAYLLVPGIGRKVVDLGGNLEKGLSWRCYKLLLSHTPTFKLIGNSMILGTLEILAEAYTLAEKSGIDAENVHSLVQGEDKLLILRPLGLTHHSSRSLSRSTTNSIKQSIVAYSDKMAHDKFDGSIGFAIDNGIKDASHIRRLTADVDSPMPVIDVAHQHLLTARALHQAKKRGGKVEFETLDWSGIVAGTRVAAGLDGLDSKKHDSIVRED
ncbi:hypothetical protein H0H92_014044 [Tricholoma furcatifolium]|nr:hypothetical protein H0H92_014044 [Tricholoma furcatifolium]